MWFPGSKKKRTPAEQSAPPADVRLPVDDLSDEDFLGFIFNKMLGRDPDPEGKAHQLKFLRAGNSRVSLLLNIMEAPEYVFKIVRDNIHHYVKLLPIKDERPDRYEIRSDRSGIEKSWFYGVREDADFDWLEQKIVKNGYYERPGVWSFIIDEDKRMMAEIAAEFGPRTVLDFGCANGAVLKCLKDMGIAGEGVEISRLALDKAPDEIRDAIHIGDLMDLALPRGYDLILGLDIFEHLNPNKLDGYIARIFGLLNEGGHVYANIPAYGKDVVFGEIFEVDYPAWHEDIAAGKCFRAIPVDEYGYPKNGHIICAGTDWWVDRFERAGFRREIEIERALHRKRDEAMEKISPARRSSYVFSKNAAPEGRQAILDRISPPKTIGI
ncbi:MAG: methyltransferase domain-containing protein [Candidatus Aminicenantes bacterium]|nr:methyltransferase domain-containing protein [Candidatus Aminicenantes bacterium]